MPVHVDEQRRIAERHDSGGLVEAAIDGSHSDVRGCRIERGDEAAVGLLLDGDLLPARVEHDRIVEDARAALIIDGREMHAARFLVENVDRGRRGVHRERQVRDLRLVPFGNACLEAERVGAVGKRRLLTRRLIPQRAVERTAHEREVAVERGRHLRADHASQHLILAEAGDDLAVRVENLVFDLIRVTHEQHARRHRVENAIAVRRERERLFIRVVELGGVLTEGAHEVRVIGGAIVDPRLARLLDDVLLVPITDETEVGNGDIKRAVLALELGPALDEMIARTGVRGEGELHRGGSARGHGHLRGRRRKRLARDFGKGRLPRLIGFPEHLLRGNRERVVLIAAVCERDGEGRRPINLLECDGCLAIHGGRDVSGERAIDLRETRPDLARKVRGAVLVFEDLRGVHE